MEHEFEWSEDIVLERLNNGGDLNQRDITDNTALHYAVWCLDRNVVSEILNHDIDINQTNYWGDTPFMMSVYKDREDIARMLISAGSDINCSDVYGRTPLMKAAKEGRLEFVRLLISIGADLDRKSNSGRSELFYTMLASDFCDKETIAVNLIRAGSNINELFTSKEKLFSWLDAMPILRYCVGERVDTLTEEHLKTWKAYRLKRLFQEA